jgi:hypothetical protein
MSLRCFLFAIPLGAGAWVCICLLGRGLYLAVAR